MVCLIYGLVDPRTRLIRYVGKSTKGLTRPRAHKTATSDTHCARWVKSLLKLGSCYEIVVLEEPHRDSMNQAECWWIAYGRASGWPLTNLTSGGDGPLGCHPSTATRKKIADFAATRIKSPEKRAKLSALAKQRFALMSNDERVALAKKDAAASAAKGFSPEVRAAISERARKRKKSALEKLKLSQAARARTDLRRSARGQFVGKAV